MRTKRSKRELFQHLVEEYRESGNEWPATSTAVARWALTNKKAKYSRRSQEEMLAREISAALREEYYTDPQGRRVRRKHCFPVIETPTGFKKQRVFRWCDIETASPDQMRASVQHRRQQMVADAKQLKTDVDSYNENNPHGAEIQLHLNLTYDVIESGLDSEYNPPRPDGGDE
jgi:hypothetical protein